MCILAIETHSRVGLGPQQASHSPEHQATMAALERETLDWLIAILLPVEASLK